MSKIKEIIKSPHIHIAMAMGFSIIVMAYFSKRILPEPIGYLFLAIPPFIGTLFELLFDKYKNYWFCKTWYWVVAVLVTSALVIFLHWN